MCLEIYHCYISTNIYYLINFQIKKRIKKKITLRIQILFYCLCQKIKEGKSIKHKTCLLNKSNYFPSYIYILFKTEIIYFKIESTNCINQYIINHMNHKKSFLHKEI